MTYKKLLLGKLMILIPYLVECINCPAPCKCNIIAGSDCSNASLSQLPPGLDRDLSILIANNNSFSSLSRFTFSKFGNSMFPHLTQLSIENNRISMVEPSTFEGMRNLKELNLNKNLLVQINPSVFRNLHKLDNLNLKHNKFLTLEKGLFRELTSLSILDLSENMIEIIREGAFKGLGSLKKLYMRSNRLDILGDSIFVDLGSLVELDLSNNIISIIRSDDFRGLWSLEVLELMFNRIGIIEKEAFIDLSNLNRLDLDDNAIKSLRGSVFKGLVNLDTLYISDNQFEHLGSDSFLGLQNLSTLYITSNNIQVIESSTFQQTPNLEFLFLASNHRLRLPEDDAFIYSGSLYYLDLSDCNLTHIPSPTFSGLPYLLTLELSNNKLRNVDREALKPMAERLSQINLENNPLECDCHLKSTWIWCKDHEVNLFGKCNNFYGKEKVSWDAFRSVDCGEELETTNYENPDEEIEAFLPATEQNDIFINDGDVYSSHIPMQTTILSRDVKPNTFSTNNSFMETKKETTLKHTVTGDSRLIVKEYDKAWSVVLILSITVCLLLMIISGLLVSLIFYRRQNRTVIYSLPQ
ncbi:hypothetical protein C0J52_08307 [Blattella germanica]|nr:hypothetical protein C0J52_08307 [Blattella germanica]